MRPKLSVVTLGVADVARARAFYETLGWPCDTEQSNDEIAFFLLDGVVLALFNWDELATDANLHTTPQLPGFRGVSLAHNEPSQQAVDDAFQQFLGAGATAVKQPTATPWGGYSGYVADLDGHLWELAHNPFADWTQSPSRAHTTDRPVPLSCRPAQLSRPQPRQPVPTPAIPSSSHRWSQSPGLASPSYLHQRRN